MNRSPCNIRPFAPYSPAEVYAPVPQKPCRSEQRLAAWSAAFSVIVLLGSVLLGLLMRDGRILLPTGAVAQPGSKENPVSPGGKCTIESIEQDADGTYFHCRSIWTLQSVLRGEEAYEFLSEQIDQLPAPEEGNEYLVLRFSVILRSSSGRAEVQFSTRYFDAADRDGNAVTQWVSQAPEDFLPVSFDEPADGFLAIQVAEGDVPTIIYQAAKDKYYYFEAE